MWSTEWINGLQYVFKLYEGSLGAVTIVIQQKKMEFSQSFETRTPRRTLDPKLTKNLLNFISYTLLTVKRVRSRHIAGATIKIPPKSLYRPDDRC